MLSQPDEVFIESKELNKQKVVINKMGTRFHSGYFDLGYKGIRLTG